MMDIPFDLSALQNASPLAFVIVFLGGVQILVVGTASLYIGRILREVQNRPLYLVRRTTNFDDNLQ